MRRFALLAAGLVAAAAGHARADEQWKTDANTCAGLYGALEARKASMAIANGAVAKSNLAQIDYAARKARMQAKIDDATKAKLYEDNFNMMVLKDTIDGTTHGMATVLTHSNNCDAAFGFAPTFAFAPKPASAPAPAAAPALPPKPAAAKISDLECSVRYLTLAGGIPENPQAQQAFMQRANAAGGRHAQANPSLKPDQLKAMIETQAKARGEKIIAKQSSLYALFTDIRACDAQYGYPLTPIPPQATGK